MEKRFIVTIGREFGTGGRAIATEMARFIAECVERKLK